ncbi:MAG: hydrogenase small subunit [Acidobacteriota bacterium]
MIAPDLSLAETLERHDYTRRDFLGFCAKMAAVLGLPATGVMEIARALEATRRPVLVWLEFQDCAGNTESMLRASHPTIAELVLNRFSWEYHETIMAAAGKEAEQALQSAVQQNKGEYVAVVEGSIPLGNPGYCTIGGRSSLDIAREVCADAAAVIAIGACAWDGGLVSCSPNPTGAVGLEAALPGIDILNLGGCPHNVADTAAVLVHWLTYKRMPAVDSYHRPLFAYGSIVHDQCERRAHYDAGEFVEQWGDEGHRRGWCLYKMGCKGPHATYNCPTVRWNDQTSWPVKGGQNCFACASHRFWDVMSPFYRRLPDVPGFGADVSAGEVGGAFVVGVAVATAAHGIAGAVRARLRKPDSNESPTITSPDQIKEARHGTDRGGSRHED